MDLATATSQRAALLARLDAFIGWTNTAEVAALDFYQIKSKMDRFEANFNAFEAANAIVAGAATTDQDRNALWDQFNGLEDRYVDARAELQRRFVELTPEIAPIPPAAAGDANANANAQNNQDARPITVQMPFQPHSVVPTWGKFSGDLLKWCDFKERFMLGVHNVKEMPEAYKISHLRNALIGEAAEAMSGFTLLNGNYDQLWNELIKKYECKFPNACAYLTKFFALPLLKKKTTRTELRRMVNDTNEMLRQLKAMEYPVEGYDLILVHALQQRLNDDLRKKWGEITKGNDNPTLVRMLEFLDDQATSHANQDMTYPLSISIPNERAQQAAGLSHRYSATANETQQHSCSVCKSLDHKVFSCPEFKPLTVADRRKVATQSKLCYNCLKSGHYTNECYDLHRCREANCVQRRDIMHNSMLCPAKGRSEYVTTVRHTRSTSPTPYRAPAGRGASSNRQS